VQIDTTAAATDTIHYVVTDGAGLTATSTRTVIIEAVQSPSIIPDPTANHNERGILNRELNSRRAIVLWSRYPRCIATRK